MRCRARRANPGDVLPVKNSYHYALPPGLVEGTVVKLISFRSGYWTVEAEGVCYEVFMALIDSGWEYEFGNRWLPANDPRVIGERSRTGFSRPSMDSVALPGAV